MASATWSVRLGKWWHDFKIVSFPSRLNRMHRVVTMPFSVFFLTYSAKIHPAYRMTQRRRISLAVRFFLNNIRMSSLSSYRAHLVMAIKLLELPPDLRGDVVECGCYKGGMTVNLSLVCRITGRRLLVYDSFEGMPPPTKHDFWPPDLPFIPGLYKGTIEEVTRNVTRLGAIEVCEFHKGWFKDTLPRHRTDIVMMVLDVDYHSSLYDCITHLWPHLVDRGYVFVDEYVYPDYCALFYSEKFWRVRFGCDPPGLIGAGSGVQVGEYYIGPWSELRWSHDPASIAYTRKGNRAVWEYYPDEGPQQESGPDDVG